MCLCFIYPIVIIICTMHLTYIAPIMDYTFNGFSSLASGLVLYSTDVYVLYI